MLDKHHDFGCQKGSQDDQKTESKGNYNIGLDFSFLPFEPVLLKVGFLKSRKCFSNLRLHFYLGMEIVSNLGLDFKSTVMNEGEMTP